MACSTSAEWPSLYHQVLGLPLVAVGSDDADGHTALRRPALPVWQLVTQLRGWFCDVPTTGYQPPALALAHPSSRAPECGPVPRGMPAGCRPAQR